VKVPGLADLRTPNVNQEQHRLNLLKKWFEQTSKTWLIDFEFVQLIGDQSPIPIQMSIRQLDGKVIFECNVNHNVTWSQFRDALSG
jgi:hypothetical protein